MTNTPIQNAISIIGNKAELARVLGVSPQFISKMCKSGLTPAAQCKKIEAATGGKVTAVMLRPDIFDTPKI